MRLPWTAGFLALAALLPAVVSTARAGDGASSCQCEQYKGLEGFSSLADEVAAIGADDLADDTPEFEKGETRTQALRLRIAASALIPDDCKQKLYAELARPHVTAFARIMAGGGQAQAGGMQTDANNLYSAYTASYNQYVQNAVSSACGLNQTTSCVSAAASAAWKSYSQTLASNPGSLPLAMSVSASNLKVIQAYQQILSSGGEAAMLAYIQSKKDGLTNEQFMTAVQMVGTRLAEDYDMVRNNEGINAKGIVTGDQLLSAAQSDTMYGQANAGGVLGQLAAANESYAGVCRDISTLQAKMLEARGFPNAMVLSYETGGPDFHTVAIAGDPGDPTKFHTFSYNLRTDTDGLDGGEALLQRTSVTTIGVPDTTLNYILNKPEGAVVAVVPSEMEKFLAEAAGFDIHQLDPLARETSSMLGASVSTDSEDGRLSGNIHLVAGQDGNGAQYLAAGETLSYGQGTIAPGKVGLVVADQTRPAAVYGTSTDENMAMLYLQAEQHLAPSKQVDKNTKVTVDNSLTVSALAGKFVTGAPETGDQGTLAVDGDIRARTEVRVEHVSDDGKSRSTYRAGVEFSPGVQDVRNMDLASDVGLALDSAYAGVQQTLQLKDMTLFGSVTAAVDAIGSRGVAQVGAAGGKWAASAFIAGRILNNTGLYEDNSIRRVGVSATFQPLKQLRVGVTGQMPIEGDAPLAEATIMGTAVVSF